MKVLFCCLFLFSYYSYAAPPKSCEDYISGFNYYNSQVEQKEQELKEYEKELQRTLKDFNRAQDKEKQTKELLEKSNGQHLPQWIQDKRALEKMHCYLIQVTTHFEILTEQLKYLKLALDEAKQAMDKHCK